MAPQGFGAEHRHGVVGGEVGAVVFEPLELEGGDQAVGAVAGDQVHLAIGEGAVGEAQVHRDRRAGTAEHQPRQPRPLADRHPQPQGDRQRQRHRHGHQQQMFTAALQDFAEKLGGQVGEHLPRLAQEGKRAADRQRSGPRPEDVGRDSPSLCGQATPGHGTVGVPPPQRSITASADHVPVLQLEQVIHLPMARRDRGPAIHGLAIAPAPQGSIRTAADHLPVLELNQAMHSPLARWDQSRAGPVQAGGGGSSEQDHKG